MKWLEWQDSARDFLLALCANGALTLWNSGTGERIWEFRFGAASATPAISAVFKFSVDPFDAQRLVCE